MGVKAGDSNNLQKELNFMSADNHGFYRLHLSVFFGAA